MQYKITGYEPASLFHFFEEISAIPRGSGNEKAVSDYLIHFAKARGLWACQDKAYNVIIRKPASQDAGQAPAVMLQGHLDMVCEKLAGCPHDFEKDGLDLKVENGILRANGTTLGGDNGAAIALMLTVLDDNRLAHPALECVFTTGEEVGLNGARVLDKSLLSARTLINLDSEEEGVATVSCAGGMRFSMSRRAAREKIQGDALHITVSGLLGGHSGMDIDCERINAVKLTGRLLNTLLRGNAGRLVSFLGGSKDNAIPRECAATLIFPTSEEAARAEQTAYAMAEAFWVEICPTEPNFSCTVTRETNVCLQALCDDDGRALVHAVCLAPNGVRRRNPKQGNFVVASLNLGIVSSEGKEMQLVFSPRSSVESLQTETVDQLTLLADTFGFQTAITGQYPGWSFAEISPIREVFCESYRNLFGKDLRIEAIHAGLECGLFSDALPGLDAIAVGPTIRGCHTPDEELPLDSFARFYTLLTDVLTRLAHA